MLLALTMPIRQMGIAAAIGRSGHWLILLCLVLWPVLPVLGQSGGDPEGRLKLEVRNGLSDAPSAPPETLRIVTFNVHFGRDIGRLSRDIQNSPILSEAQIFLIQEIESHEHEGSGRASKLAESLNLNHVYAPGRLTKNDGTHGLAILSRFPLSDIEVLRLPYYGLRRRVSLGATADVGGRPLRTYNVHLDTHINAGQHIEQLRPVVEQALRHPVRTAVIGGDFNTNPFRWLFRKIPIFYSNQAAAMDKFMSAQGFSTPLVSGGVTTRERVFKKRLDSLFTRNLTVQDSGVERRVDSSDHYPVWIDIAWP